MTDTYSRVKDTLLSVLKDPDHRVIALTGKWGTGKTYLWHAVKAELFSSSDSKQPVYISAFGAKTINDLKLRILQNAYLKDASTVRALAKTVGGVARDALKKFTGYSAEEAALVWLPTLLSGRLIVVDDVERKHKALDIDEFLGLIDEYSEIHGARFVILLNTDKLSDAAMWATLHEKVVDTEVTLTPTAGESFDIATRGKTYPYMAESRKAIVTLKLNNIRVIERVLKMIQRITEACEMDAVPAIRWIPSTVFLTASHYKAVENAPPFEYVASFNSFARALERESEQRNPQELEWDTLLQELGIATADDYERTLQEYLTSGLLDVKRLKTQFAEYVRDAENADAAKQRNEFLTDLWWDPKKTRHDLVEMARALLPTVGVMSPYDITTVVSAIEEIDDKALAREFLDKWIQSMPTRPEYQQIEERDFEISGRRLHPEVLAALNHMRDKQHPPLTVVEVVQRIVKSGWGEQERIALARSTVQDYEDALRDINNETLSYFLKKHLEWFRNVPNDKEFKNGVSNFLAACLNIVNGDSGSRLSTIISRVFQQYGFDVLDAAATSKPAAQPVHESQSAETSG